MSLKRALGIKRIVSGGQSGVDRGVLDAALWAGLPVGGWCPRGCRAEDGRRASHYGLRQTASRLPRVRTRANVLSADGVLILRCGELRGGSALTLELARRYGRPVRVVSLATNPVRVRAWIRNRRIQVLNIAGPRESESPGARKRAARWLARLLGVSPRRLPAAWRSPRAP